MPNIFHLWSPSKKSVFIISYMSICSNTKLELTFIGVMDIFLAPWYQLGIVYKSQPTRVMLPTMSSTRGFPTVKFKHFQGEFSKVSSTILFWSPVNQVNWTIRCVNIPNISLKLNVAILFSSPMCNIYTEECWCYKLKRIRYVSIIDQKNLGFFYYYFWPVRVDQADHYHFKNTKQSRNITA